LQLQPTVAAATQWFSTTISSHKAQSKPVHNGRDLMLSSQPQSGLTDGAKFGKCCQKVIVFQKILPFFEIPIAITLKKQSILDYLSN